MQQVIDLFREQRETITQQIIDAILNAQLPLYSNMPREQIYNRASAVLTPFQSDLAGETSGAFAVFWGHIGMERARQNVSVDEMLAVIAISVETMTAHFKQQLANNPAALVWWLERTHMLSFAAARTLSQAFVGAREQVIYDQSFQIRDISTPVIPIFSGILALPIAGRVDASRAGQIMETLLERITEHQADVVIVDITGVPVVDTEVANYLIQVAQAARLLGSQIVLVGIGAEIAQTMVQLGVDMATIVTRADLQSGLAYALDLHGLAITASHWVPEPA